MSAAATADLTARIYWCAPSFEQFAYRFWLENQLWRVLNEEGGEHGNGLALGAELKEYLDHYRQAGPHDTIAG